MTRVLLKSTPTPPSCGFHKPKSRNLSYFLVSALFAANCMLMLYWTQLSVTCVCIFLLAPCLHLKTTFFGLSLLFFFFAQPCIYCLWEQLAKQSGTGHSETLALVVLELPRLLHVRVKTTWQDFIANAHNLWPRR